MKAARRKGKSLTKADTDLVEIIHDKKRAAYIAVEYCDAMFLLERKWHDLNSRALGEEAGMDQFYDLLKDLGALPKTKLGRAVDYAQNQRVGLALVLTDGRLEISNNRAERAIKELVMCRKNWLFSTSFQGAEATGIIPSVMRSAETNGLNTRAYLEALFEEIPNLPVPSDPTALKVYLPWSPAMQARFAK